jgi:hypothetical protein
MASLADLFNPSFFMFLGILVLVSALLVVYFESKMRDQNHKISSMLSLVSTLADDLNSVKMGLNHVIIKGGHPFQQEQPIIFKENLGENKNINLIEVSDDDEVNSDDDDDDSDDGDNSEDEENNNNDNDEDDEDNDNEDEDNDNDNNDDDENDVNENDAEDSKLDLENELNDKNIKVLKLDILNDNLVDHNNNENVNLQDINELPNINNSYVEEVLELKCEDLEPKKEAVSILSSESKTISINLGEEINISGEPIDFRKLQLPKLRSIAVEKGLVLNTEALKLKKQELLKLLGVE